MTTDFSVWYASSTIFAIVAGLALAVYAFYVSLAGQQVGKRVEEFAQRGIGGGRLGEIADADLALAGGEGIGMQISQSYWASGVDAHGASSSSRSSRFGDVPGRKAPELHVRKRADRSASW